MSERNDVEQRMRTLRSKLRTLAKEHADAASHVDEYAKRRYLMPGEQVEMRTSQRMKVLKKDTRARGPRAGCPASAREVNARLC
jgi:hypothetical protein